MRECGKCSLCCELLAVEDLDKPQNTRCAHQKGVGCSIFGKPERPKVCSAFKCAWLWNESWPEKLRPDRCGVMFEPFNEDDHLSFAANMDPNRVRMTHAARGAIFKMLLKGHPVFVVNRGKTNVLLPSGMTRETAWGYFERARWQRQHTPVI